VPSIQNVPIEVWLEIFEYLDIADLYAFNVIFGDTLFGIVARAAGKLVKKFLVSAKPKLVSFLVCPEFHFPSESNIEQIPSGPMSYRLMLPECVSRTFQKNERNSTEMTDRRYTVRDDKVHCDGRSTRTLSHRMPLCQFEWRMSNTPVTDLVKLPREWIDFVNDDIQILMQFEEIPAATRIPRRRPDFRCLPYQLTYFEVDLTFLRMDLELDSACEADVIQL
jgi:hypothetical protein